MLEVRRLSGGYAGHPVLHDVSLTAESGRITVIAGPNGCGKSTLLKSIAGIIPYESGDLLINGESLCGLSSQEQAQRIAYLPQDRYIPDTTVFRLVLHGRFPYLGYPRRYRPEDLEIARNALARIGIESLAERPLNTLSGGMRQKVYIAMALAQDAPVIMMDEPNSFLDISHQLQLAAYLRVLASEGKTLLLVLHDLSMALRLADHLVLLKDGCVLSQGSPEQLYLSGDIETAFQVGIRRFQTPGGWHYYYEPIERE